MKKRILAAALALCLTLGLLPGGAALAAEVVASGECGAEGDNLTWALDSEGTLTISGQGEMEDYGYNTGLVCPWADYRYSGEIKNIILPQGITKIGETAFQQCISLTSIIIPDGTLSIGRRAFNGCTSLSSVTIPNSVVDMNNGVSSYNASDGTFGGCPLLVTAGPIGGNFNIEFGWTEKIPKDAFDRCQSLTSVSIPAGISTIDSQAFYACSSLIEVAIPDSVVSIGEQAFEHCTSLEHIDIPNSVIEIADSAFDSCYALTKVIIPGSVKNIGMWAFRSCASLSDLTILEGVSSIDSWAFKGCSSLTSVIIPSSATDLGGITNQSVFEGCFGLITAGPIDGDYNIKFGWNKFLPRGAFRGCSALTEVEIPNSITTIGSSAFQDCQSLDNVVIPDGVTTIGWRAFEGCSSLSNIIIPSSVTFPENTVTSGGQYYFQNCSLLKTAGPIGENFNIQFGWTEKIPGYSFDNSLLTKIKIPNGISSIGIGAFGNCTSLREIILPDSITTIHEQCFTNCANLSDVYYGGSKQQWAKINGIGVLVSDSITIHYAAADIIYDPNGGTGTMDHYAAAPGSYTLPACRFTPPEGKEFKAWSIGGVEYAPGDVYEVSADTTVTAVWQDRETAPVFTITAAAGRNGSISPSGSVQVPRGGDKAFLMTPDSGFRVARVTVDDQDSTDYYSYGPENYEVSYTFRSVERDHTISVEFTKADGEPDTPGETVKDILDGLLNDAGAAAEQIKDILESLSKGDIKDAIDKIGDGIFDRIEELEKRIGGSAEIDVAAGLGFVETDVKVTGAKLNTTYEKHVRLEINPPEDSGIVIPDQARRDTFRFSMKLVEGENNNIAELSVPIRITLPIPGLTVRPKSFTLWHRHNGELVPVTLSQAPYRGADGKWYISFKVEGFSDFIMAYDKETSGGGSSSGGGSNYTISVPSRVANGTVRVSPASAGKGARVTLTVRPDSGYVLKSLTVTTGEGRAVRLTRVSETTYTFIMPGSRVTVTPVFESGNAGSRSFSDVPEDYTFYADIAWAAECGFMGGYGDGTFRPKNNTTRQALWMVLARIDGKNPSSMAEARDWAVASGVSDGSSASSGMTRQQMVAMLYRYAQSKGYAVTGGVTLDRYPDAGSVAGYARSAMSWAVGNGIVGGTAAGTLNPAGTASRAHFAAFLHRFCTRYGIA